MSAEINAATAAQTPGDAAIPPEPQPLQVPPSAMDELLHRDHFSVEELALLLDVSPHLIRHEVHAGALRAFVVDHHIVDIRREDVCAWLAARRLI